MRGALTKESGSSFADAHRRILSEPTHMEDEDEDEEDEIEDERDWEGAMWRVEGRSDRTTT